VGSDAGRIKATIHSGNLDDINQMRAGTFGCQIVLNI
jgi:hypothetical protein